MNTHNLSQGSLDNYFSAFKAQFPTIESRYEAAQQIADPNADEAPSTFNSRNFLAAHWGESEVVLEALAHATYNLKGNLDHNRKQPVMVMESGNVGKILTSEDELSDLVELKLGIVAVNDLEYQFISGRRGRIRDDQEPILTVNARLAIVSLSSLSVDVIGEPEIDRLPDALVPVYSSVVTMSYNESAYRTSKVVTSSEVVLGEENCTEVMRALEVTSGHRGLSKVLDKVAA